MPHFRKHRTPPKSHRQLRVEPLEQRQLLAANLAHVNSVQSTAADTVNVLVTPANTPPTLDTLPTLTLGQVEEDQGTPIGTVGIPVTSLMSDQPPLSNFSDADGDLPGIAITGVNLQGGTLWFSENNGTAWQQVGTVSEAAPLLLAADADRRLYFQPAANFSGTISDVITLKAWDRTFMLQQLGTDIDGEAAGDQAGRTVSMSADGQTVAIGASGNDDNGIESGHVRIYQWTGSAWQQVGTDIDGEAAGDEAGKWNSLSLSSDGQIVAIGALYNDGNGNNSGHVRIYQWSGSAWQQLGADIDGEAAGDASGFSVSLASNGQTVAIGALYNGGLAGHVRIYQWTGSAWQQQGADIDGEAAGDRVHSVSLSADGQTVAIGANRNDGNGTDSGSARIYQWNGSAWQQVGADIDGEAAEDQAGYSISLSADGQIVAIGALYNDGNGTDSGHVRIYQWNGSTWQQVGTDIDGEAPEDLSGISVALSSNGQTVAIGAHSNDDNGNQAGQLRLYQWTGSTWEQLGKDVNGEAAGDLSGASVSLSSDGQTVAIGAMFNDGNGVDSGHVRIYRAHPVQSTAADTVNVLVTPANTPPTLNPIPSQPLMGLAAGEQMVPLTGITAGGGETQLLRVTATSSDESIIAAPAVDYTSAETTGTLRYEPTGTSLGNVTLTITVTDAGFDGDFETVNDNGVFTQQIFVQVDETPWRNPRYANAERQAWDVDDNGEIELLDALLLVNLINRFPQYASALPTVTSDLNQDGTMDALPGQGLFPDVNGDGKTTLADALAVVNKIHQLTAAQAPGGEGEFFTETANAHTTLVREGDEHDLVAAITTANPLILADTLTLEIPTGFSPESTSENAALPTPTVPEVNDDPQQTPNEFTERVRQRVSKGFEHGAHSIDDVDLLFGLLTDEDWKEFRSLNLQRNWL